MTVNEFCNAINVQADSYYAFMMKDGEWEGLSASTYGNAWRFFKGRELRGIKMPSSKIAKKKPTAKSVKKPAIEEDPEKYHVSGIHLDDESDGEVEIYETCDSLRRIVKAHLNKSDVSQVSFLRQVSNQFGNQPKKITAAQLRGFMEKSGAHAGASSAFFYGAYVYFEKLRIKNGEEMSEFRQEMEDIWFYQPFQKHAGFPRHGGRQTYILSAGSEAYLDEYGRVRSY
jgi:hypothetical protein